MVINNDEWDHFEAFSTLSSPFNAPFWHRRVVFSAHGARARVVLCHSKDGHLEDAAEERGHTGRKCGNLFTEAIRWLSCLSTRPIAADDGLDKKKVIYICSLSIATKTRPVVCAFKKRHQKWNKSRHIHKYMHQSVKTFCIKMPLIQSIILFTGGGGAAVHF